MGSFQGSQTGDRSQAGVFSEFVEQYNVVALFRLGVGLPPGVGGIVIPAVDAMLAVRVAVQYPAVPNFAKGQAGAVHTFRHVNVIAAGDRMVVVDFGICREHHSRVIVVTIPNINAAAVAIQLIVGHIVTSNFQNRTVCNS